jgi:hypothetical protein
MFIFILCFGIILCLIAFRTRDPEFVTSAHIPYEFFTRMSTVDLYARRSDCIEEYYARYIASITEFTAEEKKILCGVVNDARRILAPYPAISSINWRFMKVDPDIENGYPHTMAGMIIFNEAVFALNHDDLVELAIHEQIHLFQRKFRWATARLVQQWGFYQNSGRIPGDRRRNNPDTDLAIYNFQGEPLILEYASNRPSDIADVETSEGYAGFSERIVTWDHPHEIMAYELAAGLVHGVWSPALRDTRAWMQSYL